MTMTVTREFCDERSKRVTAEIKGEIEKLIGKFEVLKGEVQAGAKTQEELKQLVFKMNEKMDHFSSELVEQAQHASNGQIRIVHSYKYKAAVASAIIMAAASIIIKFIG